MKRRITLLVAIGATLLACGIIDPDSDERSLDLTLFLPESQTLHQTGLEFAFQSSGSTPYRSVSVVVDPGTASERTFTPDDAWREEAPEKFPVIVTGPLANGSHVFELRVEDADGRTGKAQFTRTIQVLDVPYVLQFLGQGFDDSRAVGITSSGLVAGTVFTGTSPNQTSQIVAWNGGTRTQPRAQATVTASAAVAISSLGEIVGSGTISGSSTGVLWRADSLDALKVDDQPTALVLDIDDNHRALVLTPAFKPYLLDINSRIATAITVGPGVKLNGPGQMVWVNPQLYGTSVSTSGGLTIKFPGLRPGRHERLFRGIAWGISALNDRGEVVGTREGDVFLSYADSAVFLDFRLPGARHCLSASGDVVVVAGTDSLYMWSPAKGTRRLTFANSGWTIDGLVGMNANGHLVAHGVNAGTNQKGVLLLSPAP